jgi:DNA-binding protein HU-beta
MTREELISQMASDAKITKVQAKAALGSIINAVTKTLKKGGRLSLVGFGTFTVSKRSARIGRNPKTGEALQIKARKVARFKAGSVLSQIVNGNK